MRPALEVADVFRRHGEAFRRDRGAHLGRVERRVMAAIEACRTATLGGHVEQCGDCGLTRPAYNSCRNRHCPKCQGLARAEWLEARQAELLPVPSFHVVFTAPAAPPGSPRAAALCAVRNGSSTASVHSPAPNRCSPTSAATPIVSPSPTAASPGSPTARSASLGKITAITARPR